MGNHSYTVIPNRLLNTLWELLQPVQSYVIAFVRSIVPFLLVITIQLKILLHSTHIISTLNSFVRSIQTKLSQITLGSFGPPLLIGKYSSLADLKMLLQGSTCDNSYAVVLNCSTTKRQLGFAQKAANILIETRLNMYTRLSIAKILLLLKLAVYSKYKQTFNKVKGLVNVYN